MERIPEQQSTNGHTAPADCLCTDCTVDPADCPLAREAEHPRRRHHLAIRNILALAAAVLFMAALLVSDKNLLFKALAYGLGALAYIGELLVMTSAFKKTLPKSELLMPLLFGAMYVVLGMSYALEHHYFG